MSVWDVQTEFAAGIFSDQVTGGRCAATVQCDGSGLVAQTANGQRFFLRYDQLQLELGGASGRMLFCRNSDRSLTIFCEERGFPAALELHAGAMVSEQLAALFSTARRGRRVASLLLLVGTPLLVLGLVGLYFAILQMGRAAVMTLPVAVDQKIGDVAAVSLQQGSVQLTDPRILEPCRQIVDRLSPHAALPGLEFQISIVDSPDVNAVCLPGGRIVIFRGLLETAQTAEEVAGVLSHEMAHATLRHGLQSAVRSTGVIVAAELLIGDAGGLVAVIAELGQHAAITKYSREQETQSDAEGVRMLHAAAVDPLALASFFERLKEQQQQLPMAINWLSTHPQHDVRIAAIRAQVATLAAQQYRGLEVDWDGLKQSLQE